MQPPTDNFVPAGRPRPPAKRGKDVVFAVVLIVLAALAALAWFADPKHRWPGDSRVGWPATAPAKAQPTPP